MKEDSIVEEIHRIRERIVADFKGDTKAYADFIRQQTDAARKTGRKVVLLPPRRLAEKAKSA